MFRYICVCVCVFAVAHRLRGVDHTVELHTANRGARDPIVYNNKTMTLGCAGPITKKT